MESLNNTDWDVVIAGTGLQESLLALSLSRSGKRVLHVDRNNYYGGADAALSLQEAEQWAKDFGTDGASIFSNAEVVYPIEEQDHTTISKLAFSRAYSLALAPQIIYTRSPLLRSLVSARVDTQLDFLAVGSWWVYTKDSEATGDADNNVISRLIRVPSGREDVVADPSIGPKAKRSLMKFLRFVIDFEEQTDIWENSTDIPFEDFLTHQFDLSQSVQLSLLALTTTSLPRSQITTSYALPRIARHLRSIGLFGPGFGAVVPKWGGLAELAQIGCRAGAVGGGVYVLGNGVDEIIPNQSANSSEARDGSSTPLTKLRLKSSDTITTKWMVGSRDDIPSTNEGQHGSAIVECVCRSISIVSSPLSSLFPPLAEGAPSPAVAVVAIQSSALSLPASGEETGQIYIMVHSADTGECPQGQSILYANVTGPLENGFSLLDKAVTALLEAVNKQNTPAVLWKLQYEQHATAKTQHGMEVHVSNNIATFPAPPLDLAFDDATLGNVKKVWELVVEGEDGEFLQFPLREGEAGDDEVE